MKKYKNLYRDQIQYNFVQLKMGFQREKGSQTLPNLRVISE